MYFGNFLNKDYFLDFLNIFQRYFASCYHPLTFILNDETHDRGNKCDTGEVIYEEVGVEVGDVTTSGVVAGR